MVKPSLPISKKAAKEFSESGKQVDERLRSFFYTFVTASLADQVILKAFYKAQVQNPNDPFSVFLKTLEDKRMFFEAAYETILRDNQLHVSKKTFLDAGDRNQKEVMFAAHDNAGSLLEKYPDLATRKPHVFRDPSNPEHIDNKIVFDLAGQRCGCGQPPCTLPKPSQPVDVTRYFRLEDTETPLQFERWLLRYLSDLANGNEAGNLSIKIPNPVGGVENHCAIHCALARIVILNNVGDQMMKTGRQRLFWLNLIMDPLAVASTITASLLALQLVGVTPTVTQSTPENIVDVLNPISPELQAGKLVDVSKDITTNTCKIAGFQIFLYCLVRAILKRTLPVLT